MSSRSIIMLDFSEAQGCGREQELDNFMLARSSSRNLGGNYPTNYRESTPITLDYLKQLHVSYCWSRFILAAL
jgi:hypothetical protein